MGGQSGKGRIPERANAANQRRINEQRKPAKSGSGKRNGGGGATTSAKQELTEEKVDILVEKGLHSQLLEAISTIVANSENEKDAKKAIISALTSVDENGNVVAQGTPKVAGAYYDLVVNFKKDPSTLQKSIEDLSAAINPGTKLPKDFFTNHQKDIIENLNDSVEKADKFKGVVSTDDVVAKRAEIFTSLETPSGFFGFFGMLFHSDKSPDEKEAKVAPIYLEMKEPILKSLVTTGHLTKEQLEAYTKGVETDAVASSIYINDMPYTFTAEEVEGKAVNSNIKDQLVRIKNELIKQKQKTEPIIKALATRIEDLENKTKSLTSREDQDLRSRLLVDQKAATLILKSLVNPKSKGEVDAFEDMTKGKLPDNFMIDARIAYIDKAIEDGEFPDFVDLSRGSTHDTTLDHFGNFLKNTFGDKIAGLVGWTLPLDLVPNIKNPVTGNYIYGYEGRETLWDKSVFDGIVKSTVYGGSLVYFNEARKFGGTNAIDQTLKQAKGYAPKPNHAWFKPWTWGVLRPSSYHWAKIPGVNLTEVANNKGVLGKAWSFLGDLTRAVGSSFAISTSPRMRLEVAKATKSKGAKAAILVGLGAMAVRVGKWAWDGLTTRFSDEYEGSLSEVSAVPQSSKKAIEYNNNLLSLFGASPAAANFAQTPQQPAAPASSEPTSMAAPNLQGKSAEQLQQEMFAKMQTDPAYAPYVKALSETKI